MKTLKRLLYMIPLIGMLAIACTDVENIEIEHIGGNNTRGDGQYYADLRAYKEQWKNYGRPVAFGWFSNWAPTGPMRRGYLSSMPDSMDIVSMWSGAPGRFEITPEQKADKEFVQKVKGIKLLEVSLLSHLGKGRTPAYVYEEVNKQAEEEGWTDAELSQAQKLARWDFWGFTSHDLSNTEELNAALAKFAKAICDSLVVNEWDGYDIDWEPGAGFNDADGTINSTSFRVLVKEMAKYIGPASDPENKGHKLFLIDGEISGLNDLDPYVDYWVNQAYGSSGPNWHGSNKPDMRKVIIAENFESGYKHGGQLLRQAAWMPAQGYKGGFGAYRFDNDYENKPDYKWMRQGIQINQQKFKEWQESQAGGEDGEAQ